MARGRHRLKRDTLAMTFDNAYGHTVDYAKFIVQLWNYYILLVVAIIGWLITLRSKPVNLVYRSRGIIIACFGIASAVFFIVLEQNDGELIQLIQLAHELAQVDANARILNKVFGPTIDGRVITVLELTARLVLPIIAALIGLFIWFITEPVTGQSSPQAVKTEV
jgi:hypothetical protein